jgi:hypothetical protein
VERSLSASTATASDGGIYTYRLYLVELHKFAGTVDVHHPDFDVGQNGVRLFRELQTYWRLADGTQSEPGVWPGEPWSTGRGCSTANLSRHIS